MTPTAVTTGIDDAGRATTRIEYDGTIPRPPLGGSLAFLLLSFPLGIAWFVMLVTLISVGVGTAVVWVGLAVLALAVLGWRGGAQVERARVYALLDTVIANPYRALPAGSQGPRWKARLRDPQTWRDLAYLFVLFPLGIVEFTLVVASWGYGIGLATLPIHYRWLPDGAWHFPSWHPDARWFTVDSVVDALPWAALGVVMIGFAVALTRWLAGTHARFARWLLGPRGQAVVAG
ncbi:MAG: sensor domain-containing protein [Thermocrispum sp.]